MLAGRSQVPARAADDTYDRDELANSLRTAPLHLLRHQDCVITAHAVGATRVSTEVKYVHLQYRRCCSWFPAERRAELEEVAELLERANIHGGGNSKQLESFGPSLRSAIARSTRTAISRPRKRTTPTCSRISQQQQREQPSPSSPSPRRRQQQSNEILGQALNSLQQALQPNNLSSAQTAFATLQQDLLQFTEFGAATQPAANCSRKSAAAAHASSSSACTNRNKVVRGLSY